MREIPAQSARLPGMTRKEFLALLATASASQALAQTPTVTPATPTPAPVKKPIARPLTLPPIQAGPPYLLAGPMLGHVGTDSARIWVRATAPTPWKVRLAESAALDDGRELNGSALAEETGCTGTLTIEGLKPDTRYYYQTWLDDRPQTAGPLPSFVTAPSGSGNGLQRIAFGSCVGETVTAAAPAWAELAARRDLPEGGFDLLLMLGDNHYANTAKVEKLRTYYTAHRLSAGWRELTAHRPIYAIWDDHDYGVNDSDATQPGKLDSLRTFHEFWANPPNSDAADDGCYYTFQRGDVQFFMLDCRFNRSPNRAPDGPDKTIWGERQLAWLKRELLASTAPVKLLAQGSEWESFGSDDSYARFRYARDAFFKWVDEQIIEGVILLSGDRHFSSAYHVNRRFLEFSSGPFGSGNARLRPNPERFSGWDDGKLWMILEVDTRGAEPKVAYELWQAVGGLLERRSFTWAQLHGKEPVVPSPSPLVPPRFPSPAAPKTA